MANKVEFGISNLYVGTYTEEGGTVTLGTPIHQPGAVSMTTDADTQESNFYADNVKYYSAYNDNGLTGTLTVAKFDDEFKKAFLGYADFAQASGGIAKVKTATKPNAYVIIEAQGDANARRIIFYNVAFGEISRSYETIEDQKTPTTEAIDFTCVGDNATGITFASFSPTDAAYATLFTTPPAPAL